jgi:RNA recognition motif-containing protein
VSISLDSGSAPAKLEAAWFRLFVGDLSNDVSDDVLTNAFNKYASFTKARVIRDRLSQKVSNLSYCYTRYLISRLQAKYGFVAFSDPEDFLKAWKEMDGKSMSHAILLLANFFP